MSGDAKPSIADALSAWATDVADQRRLEAARLDVERLSLEAETRAASEPPSDNPTGPRRPGQPALDAGDTRRRYEEGVRKARDTKRRLDPDDTRQPTYGEIAEAIGVDPRTVTRWRRRFDLPAPSKIA